MKSKQSVLVMPPRSHWLQLSRAGDLGVHIPDVAAYVTPGSALDEVARNRLRTYYLGETILTMLPELNILEQPEHLAISALLKLDQEGALISFEVHPQL